MLVGLLCLLDQVELTGRFWLHAAAQKVLVTRCRDWTVCGEEPRPVHLRKRQADMAAPAEEAACDLDKEQLMLKAAAAAPAEAQPWRDDPRFRAVLRLLFDAQLHAHSEGEQQAYLKCIDPLFQVGFPPARIHVRCAMVRNVQA